MPEKQDTANAVERWLAQRQYAKVPDFNRGSQRIWEVVILMNSILISSLVPSTFIAKELLDHPLTVGAGIATGIAVGVGINWLIRRSNSRFVERARASIDELVHLRARVAQIRPDDNPPFFV